MELAKRTIGVVNEDLSPQPQRDYYLELAHLLLHTS